MPKTMTINHGLQFPYDRRELPATPSRKVALGVLADLTDRKGVGNELEVVDDDIRAEIVDDIAAVVDTVYKDAVFLPNLSEDPDHPTTPTWMLTRKLYGVAVDRLGLNPLNIAEHASSSTMDALYAVLQQNIGTALEPHGAVTDVTKESEIWKMANDIFTATMLNMPNEVYGLVSEQRSEDITESIYWTLLQYLGKGPYTPTTVKQLNNLHSIAVTDDVGYSVAYAPTVQQFTVQTMGQTLSHNTTTSDSLFDAVKQASGKLG